MDQDLRQYLVVYTNLLAGGRLVDHYEVFEAPEAATQRYEEVCNTDSVYIASVAIITESTDYGTCLGQRMLAALDNSPTQAAIQKLIAQCGDDVWGECAQFPRVTWRFEVANEETNLGYWEWVVHQAGDEGISVADHDILSGIVSPSAGVVSVGFGLSQTIIRRSDCHD